MRLHTSLTELQVVEALIRSQRKGHVAASVGFMVRATYRSRSHAGAFEIQLGSDTYSPIPEPVNRYGRTQKTRRRSQNGSWAATWREWGWFIAEIYAEDPLARWGAAPKYDGKDDKRWGYFDLTDFDQQTDYEFCLD